MRLTFGLAMFAVLTNSVAAEVPLPEGWQRHGEWTAHREGLVAGTKANASGPLRPEQVTEINLRLGERRKPATIRITAPNGKPLELTLSSADANLPRGGKDKKDLPLPDACVDIGLHVVGGGSLFRDRYFVRPNPLGYKKDDRTALLTRWNDLPGASQQELRLKIEKIGADASVWIDDRFVGRAAIGAEASLDLNLSPGNVLGNVSTRPLPAGHARYVPIGLHGYRRPGGLAIEAMPVPRGRIHGIGEVPFDVAGKGDEVDVGKSRWLDEAVGPNEFADEYYSRHAFDSRPEDIVLAVPTDDYSYAHVLCLVDPDPAKTPVLTLRLSRFLNNGGDSGGRGDALADSSIRLEQVDGRWPAGCRPVGKVRVKDRAGDKELPLLHVALPNPSGHIADVIDESGTMWGRSTQYLDLELTKELHTVRTFNYGAHSIKPLGRPSAVQVHALTLERAAVKVRLQPRQVGHVFYPSENPGYDLEMTNRASAAFSGSLSWRIVDFYGASKEGKREVKLAAGATRRVAVDPAKLEIGWHRAELRLRDGAGRTIWESSTSLAVLAPDTRRAGSDSPYSTWWFRQSHIGTKSVDEIGPLFKRMGFRHVSPGDVDAKQLGRHDLSIGMYPYFGGALPQATKKLDDYIAKHPGRKWAMVFHENGIGETYRYAPEFMGEKPPPLADAQKQRLKNLVDHGIAYAKHIRAKHPGVKLIVGNGGSPFAIELIRQGFPREYVDAWGDETLGQAIVPEGPPSWNGTVYWLAEYSKRFGYQAAITSCYEWRGRGTNPGNLSEVEQAQFYCRDVLEGLAYGMPHINPGLIHDVGDAYYYSRWGSGGFCRRWPLLDVKPSYVAMSVLTQQLDEAKFRRLRDTDSPSLLAMEFSRGAEWVYVLWLPRGQREVTLTFKDDDKPRWVDMNGKTRELATTNKETRILVSASPAYLTSKSPLAGFKSGPTTCAPAPQQLTVVDPLDDASAWEIVREHDEQLETCHFDFPRRLGKVRVEGDKDSEMKKVLKLTLEPQPDVPWPAARYATLKPKKALRVPGKPASIGVWVKGNSSWGRIFFELEDSRGKRFFSIGAPCDGFCAADWKGNTFVNFDGWNYVQVPLPFKYASGFYGAPQCEWNISDGAAAVNYPVRVTRLVVEMRDKIVRVNQAIDVTERSIQLSKLSVGKP